MTRGSGTRGTDRLEPRFTPTQEHRRFVRFLFVGLLNTAFGYGIYALALAVGWSPAIALLIATVVGVLFNFVTTGQMVFANNGIRRLPRFVLCYCVTYLINLGLLTLLLRAGLSNLAAQALLLPVMVVCSFTLLRKFVFPGGMPAR